MTAFTNHFLFEFKTGLRNPSAMMMIYLLPLGFYAAMGFVMVEDLGDDTPHPGTTHPGRLEGRRSARPMDQRLDPFDRSRGLPRPAGT